MGENYIDACWPATVKHGFGSVMVWSCIPANGVVHLVNVDDIIRTPKHKQILTHHAIPFHLWA